MRRLWHFANGDRTARSAHYILSFIYTLILFLPRVGVAATEGRFTAEEVKSAFLLNFGRFVEWPPQKLEKSRDRFYICLVGEDTLGMKLEAIIRGQKVQERTPEIIRLPTHFPSRECEIAYLNLRSTEEASEVLSRMRSTPTLTVGEGAHFLKAGGIIQLRVEGEHIRLKINLKAAKNSGLTISSKLLAIAEVVE